MTDKEIQKNFEFIVDAVKNSTPLAEGGPTDTEKLKFYALYKQATVGKCNTTQPWAFNVVERAKWNAWNDLGNMSKQTAMLKYCEHYANLSSKYE
jgi:peroxisomal 3,2-trans-enoyl-CoA isomerase